MELFEALTSITYFNPKFSDANKIRIYHKYEKIYSRLNWSEVSDLTYDNEMILLITNVLNKFGFVLLSRDSIVKLGNKKDSELQVLIQYNFNNFLFYTKSTLDAIALVINEVYQLGRKEGKIDLRYGSFCDEVIKKYSKSMIAAKIKAETVWINEVIKWRDEINHRTFSVVGQLTDAEVLGDYTYRIPQEPVNMLVYGNNQNLFQKYGENITQTITTFCERWVNKCKDLVEILGDELFQNIILFKK